ncbi:beta-carbonic anhydrase 1 [Anaerotignum neopropionicum]|uniref:carbonic anhydrase n=1 Tax=Anaerotignum neopropionicum TaxID=36847 RepID=A0A136WHG3_9FIRM|nr:carbonic anhydrase [Anaerotignum neopropionicum]KXL54008.1 beta-carbonic anhydrase 1 [Anaerotignum neopropionicum]
MNERVRKMLEYNRVFVENELYSKYATSKYPDRKIAILSCMDTRMTELLPAALGFKNGDVKMIKNAGAQISHPYGSVIFSFLIAIYELGVDTVLVIGHDDCGVQILDGLNIVEKMKAKGITQEALAEAERNHRNPVEWLTGFGDVSQTVEKTVEMIQTHPLIYNGVEVYGFVMNPETGEVREV